MAIFSRLKRSKTSKTEVVTFSRLDYWSMLDLFDRIPLHDLVRLNGLASWWSGYVTKVCRTKRDITVRRSDQSKRNNVTGDDSQDQFNLLKLTSIDSHTSDRLVHLLPSITSLEIIMKTFQPDDIADIAYLISQWSHQLVRLKIEYLSEYSHGLVETEDLNRQFKQLIRSLNTLTSLRRLLISCEWWECLSKWGPIDLPILSHLEYLYYYTGYYDLYNLKDSLVRYAGPNCNLKLIELPSTIWYREKNALLGEHQLLSKLTILKLFHSNPFTSDQWALFPNLTTVNLGPLDTQSHFMTLITGMQCLKFIRNLDVKLHINRDIDGDFEQVDPLPQLPSLTNLKFETGEQARYPLITSYSYYKSLQLGIIFPNVQSLHLSYCYEHSSSSFRVLKWMANTCSKIRYQMNKLRVQRELSGVECVFKPKYYRYN